MIRSREKNEARCLTKGEAYSNKWHPELVNTLHFIIIEFKFY